MEVRTNQPIEVTKSQYHKAMVNLSWAVAGRKANNKYYIKLLAPRYKEELKKILS